MNSELDRKWILGIGSHHGWDRIGWLVAERLKNKVEAEVRLITSPIQIMDIVEECDDLVLIDACLIAAHEEPPKLQAARKSNAPRPLVHRWQWPDPAILSTKFSGTHDLSVAAVLELAERLQMLPKRVVLWGIDISHIDSMKNPAPQQIVEEALRGIDPRGIAVA